MTSVPFICLMVIDGLIGLLLELLMATQVNRVYTILLIIQIVIAVLECAIHAYELRHVQQTRYFQLVRSFVILMQIGVQFEIYLSRTSSDEIYRIISLVCLGQTIFNYDDPWNVKLTQIQIVVLYLYVVARLSFQLQVVTDYYRLPLFATFTLIFLLRLNYGKFIPQQHLPQLDQLKSEVKIEQPHYDFAISGLQVGVIILDKDLHLCFINKQANKIMGNVNQNRVISALHQFLIIGLEQNGVANENRNQIHQRTNEKQGSMKTSFRAMQTILNQAERHIKRIKSVSVKLLELQLNHKRALSESVKNQNFEELFLSFYEANQKQSQMIIENHQTIKINKLKVNLTTEEITKYYQIHFCQYKDESNQIVYLLYIYDISKIERLQLYLQKQQFTNFHFNSFSHELRTPLNCSLQLLQGLKQKIGTDESLNQYLRPALVANKLLMHQINDILDYASFGLNSFKINIKEFYITQVFDALLEYYKEACDLKGINLNFVIKDNLRNILIFNDMERVIQLSVNLLNNSIKFTQAGKSITVTAQDKTKSVGIMSEQFIKVIVLDTGRGISKAGLLTIQDILSNEDKTDALSQIKNFTSKYIGLGFTIGNKIASELANTAKSHFKIRSQQFLYTKVSFRIRNHSNSLDRRMNVSQTLILLNRNESDPLSDSPEQMQQQDVGGTQRVPELNLKRYSLSNQGSMPQLPDILICDDVAFNILALRSLLATLGHHCDVAHDGEQAVNQVKQRLRAAQNGYKLILMDIEMPGLNGYQATIQIKQLVTNVTIIMCSAYDNSDNIEEAMHSGMKDVIAKPVKLEILKSMLAKYLT